MKRHKISKKQQLIYRIEQAQALYPEYADLFEDIRIEVENRYPQVNSNYLWEITCPICGTTRELRIAELYNGKGLDMCSECRSRLASESGHDARLSAASTPEVRHRAALTSIQNGTGGFSPEARRKAALTMWSQGSLNSDTARKSWETRNKNS